jgi:hypothetical protein
MPLVVGGIMGGLALGQGIFGGLSANSQQQAQAMQAQLQAQNANFQRQWQIDAANRAIDKKNLARAINNKKIEQVALNDRGIAEVYAKLGFDNSKSQYSKQTNQINSALLSSVAGRNISASSGTARALLRQNLQNATANMANLRVSNMNKMRDIEVSYQNKLAQRDFNYEEFNVFLPGDTSMVGGTSMTNIIGGAALGGLSAGVTGALMFGRGSGGGGGGNTGGGSPYGGFEARAGG